jgi:hypothetical protein
MTRRETARVKQLTKMYSIEDGRLQGPAGWEKLPFFWFLLFLTYHCTQKRSYCYAFNQVGEENVDEMDERTFSRLLEWIPEVWKANNTKVNAIDELSRRMKIIAERSNAIGQTVVATLDDENL